MKIKLLITVQLLILSLQAFADAMYERQLTATVGWTKPPYVIEHQDSGFELELVKHVFSSMGYKVSFVYVPFGRSNTLLKANKVDVALTMNSRMDTEGLVLSDPYITYQNAAISLRGRGIEINQMSDLGHYSMIGFQNSSIILGSDYQAATEKSRLYLELPNQRNQVEMLLKGKVDIVVMDINIFNYLSREYLGKSHMVNVDTHRLFPATQYQMAFRDKELVKSFNQQLAAFKESEDYQQLLKEYEFLQ